MKQRLFIIGATAIIWSVAWFGSHGLQQLEGRRKPTTAFSSQQGQDTEERSAQDWLMLGKTALTQSRSQPAGEGRARTLFQAQEAFSRVLKETPKKPEALLGMAEVLFEFGMFERAASYYEQYVAVEPENLRARAQLASAYTFSSRFGEAENILQGILNDAPENFEAHAYLAITYAQQGKMDKAREVGERAVELAPVEEAKLRFTQFLDALDKKEQSASSAQQAQGPRASLRELLRNHPITGPKFVRLEEREEGVVALYFRDFPMAQMPPFARQKFLATLKGAQGVEEVKKLIFIDDASGETMAEESL